MWTQVQNPISSVEIVQVDGFWARVTGLPRPTIEKLRTKISYFVEGAEYSAPFQRGQWDGYKRLLEYSGKFPAGLIPRMHAELVSLGIPEEIIKIEVISPGFAPLEKPLADIELRDYQKEAVQTMVDCTRGILSLPPATGKTRVAVAVMSRLASMDHPALFLCHTQDIFDQTCRDVEELIGKDVLGRLEGGRDWDIDKPILIGMIQALNSAQRAYEVSEVVKKVGTIITDECHHQASQSYVDLAKRLTSASYLYGLSGTPFRADGADLMLEAVTGPVIYQKTHSEMVELGWLVQPVVYMISNQPITPVIGEGYHDIYRQAVVENTERNRAIMQQARNQVLKQEQTLILVAQVAHGLILEQGIPEAELVIGSGPNKTPKKKRREIFERFRNREIPIIIATTLADEGLDIPCLDAVIMAGAGKSDVKTVQRVGRAMRLSPGKETASIYDFEDRHNRMMARQAQARTRCYNRYDWPIVSYTVSSMDMHVQERNNRVDMMSTRKNREVI